MQRLRPLRLRAVWRLLPIATLPLSVASAAPDVSDDVFSTPEDTPLIVTDAPLIDADFDGGNGAGGAVVFDADWSYLDQIQNENGTNQGYPVDGSGNAWNSVTFDVASSTIGPWASAAMPLRGGDIVAFQSAPDLLDGLGDAANGQNLVTTYLFRNTFTLTEAQAAEADWTATLLVDDGCVIYINGVEVDRINLPGGLIATTTTANVGDESNYTDRALSLGGLLVAGSNVIAVEVHQTTLTSSDVGIDLGLSSGGSETGGFSYVDDFFGTNIPDRADGSVAQGAGFAGSNGLNIQLGRGNFLQGGAKSGAWTRDFELSAPGSVEVSFRYRQLNQDPLDDGEFTEVILDIGGTRYGDDQNSSVSYLEDGGDSGWQLESRTVALPAGNHTLALGFFNNSSRRNNEYADVWFDDVRVEFSGGPGGVLENDSGAAPVTATLVSTTANGSLNFASDGTFSYLPAPDFSGTDSFTYRAVDNSGSSEIATVTITVEPVNDPPVAIADSYSLTEDVTLSVGTAGGLLSNDGDVEDQPLGASVASQPDHGTVTVNADGSFDYIPAQNFFGVDRFTYTATDGAATSAPATVTLNISAADDPPIAKPDSYTADENTPLVITETGSGNVVFSTNFDSGAEPEISGGGVIEGVSGFSGLGAEGNQFAGQFLHSPTGLSGNGLQTPVTLTLTDLPEHTSLSIGFLLAVLDTWDGIANNFNSDYLQIQLDGNVIFRHFLHSDPAQSSYVPPAGGQLSAGSDLSGNGFDDSAFDMSLEAALRDIPHSSPTATITFAAGGGNWDGAGAGESWAMDNLSVSISDTPRDITVGLGTEWRYIDDGSDQGNGWQAPAFDDAAWKTGDGKFGYGDGDETTEILFGSDPDNKHPTTYFRREFDVADPAAYSAFLVALQHDDGAAVYLNGTEIIRTNLAPEADAGELASSTLPSELESTFFTHTIDPGLLVAGTNVLAAEVHQGSNSSSDLAFHLAAAGISTRSAGGVLANDIEPDGEALEASLLADAGNGSVSLNPDGTFTYVPGINFHGTDTFTYASSDGINSTSATVTITVNPGPNDIPETVADRYAGTEDQTLTVAVVDGVLANDIDPDLDPMTVSVETPPANGSLTLAADGSFTFVPHPDFAGTDSFSYIANDTIDDSFPTLVTLDIAAVADRPVVADDQFVAQPGQVLDVPAAGVLANDRDADEGTTLGAVLVSIPASGTLDLATDGGFSYTPAEGFRGTASFSYRASDGALQSLGAATVLIHVNGRPSAAADSYSGSEDTTLSAPAPGVLANDDDPEGDSLEAIIVSPPAHGSLSLAADGSFEYVPEEDYFGADSFTYAASDGLQATTPVTVSIDLAAINDPPVALPDVYTIIAEATTSLPAAEGVLANDSDVDGPSSAVTIVDNVRHGSLSASADGSFSYTPDPGFVGEDSFSYLVTDGSLESGVTTVDLRVVFATESIVINEIMYHPVSDDGAHEFIELFNRSDADIDLGGWRFTSGIDFTLPPVVIPAGGYLVVAADTAAFTGLYGSVPLLVGGWTGGLSNRGERLRLVDPGGEEADELSYSDQGDWAVRRSLTDGNQQGWEWFASHDGGGTSLELIDAGLSNKSGQNWTASNGSPSPGAANTAAQEDIAPLISAVEHTPPVPRSSDPVTITAKLKDHEGSTLHATLHYRISTESPGEFTSVAMADDGQHGDGEAGDGEFGVTLPPDANLTVYEFFVSASDGTNTRTWPAPTNTGQDANALFQFDDEEFTGHHPIYRTIISVPDEERFPFNNRSSNAELNATFIADNCGDISVRYLAGMRIRGASSRNDTPPPIRVNLSADDPWDGETRLNLNTQFTWLQFIGMKLFQASGMPAPDTKRIAMRRNGIDRSEEGEEGYGSIVHVQPLQEEFLDSHIPSDAGGNLYKKVRPDNDWAYREGDVDAYLADGWGKQTNASENDWSDLDEWLRVMNEADAAPDYIAQVEAVANLDQWMRWFACMTILTNGETNASNGTDDDYSIYRGVADTRFIFIPHDLDTILGQGDGSSITNPESTIFDMVGRGDSLAPLVPLFQDPGILTRYYGALRELLQTTFSAEQFDAMLDNHLTGWIPAERISDMKTFMDQRRAHITGLVDAELGPPPAAVLATTDATLDSPRGELYISEVLADNASAYQVGAFFPDAIELRNSGGATVSLAGMSLSDNPDLPGRYVFPSGTEIAAGGSLVIDSITLGFALDTDGDSISLYAADGSTVIDSVEFGLQLSDYSLSRTGPGETTWALTTPTIGSPNAPAQALGNPDSLHVNEWLVRPQVTFEDDFVELYNPDPLPVALGGLIITDEPVAHPQRHRLPPLSFIAGSGFAMLYPVGGDAADEANQLPYKLSADHGWLSISGTNGVEIDEVHYICQRDDISFGRETDGASAIVDFDLPTPGFSNATDLSAEALLLESLRITEIMYHPEIGELEFLRLKNIGSATINLAGIRMNDGVAIDLPAADLAPGESTVIVRDQVAYEAAFGAGGVLGEYSGALSNGGERLRLEIASLGFAILDFDYDDAWYPITDGLGGSLGIVDESAPRDSWDERRSWRPLGGNEDSYGGWAATRFNTQDPLIAGPEADPDQDGIANAVEFALGLDPLSGDRAGLLGSGIEGDYLTLTYPRNKGADAQWIVEAAGDVSHWQPGPSEVMLSDDGEIEIWKATDSVPITTGQKRFMRVRIVLP